LQTHAGPRGESIGIGGMVVGMMRGCIFYLYFSAVPAALRSVV
jgi:hypothetical protein